MLAQLAQPLPHCFQSGKNQTAKTQQIMGRERLFASKRSNLKLRQVF
jgi:hypothetical protein